MSELLVRHISAVAVLTGFLALVWGEARARAGAAPASGPARSLTNWSLGAVNLGIAALLPLTALGAAMLGPMPFARVLDGSGAAIAVAPFLLLRSLTVYAVHVLSHRIGLLWRFHRVHHADRDLDLSTALRHHPGEALLAAGVAALPVVLLGPPVQAVIAVEALLLLAALWQHAAIALPDGLSASIERLLITPRLHRVHHAADRALHDRNYGDILSIWDRMFGTYQPPHPEETLLGLADDACDPDSFAAQLVAPFRAAARAGR